jgi:intracellular multiplication protein IcmC
MIPAAYLLLGIAHAGTGGNTLGSDYTIFSMMSSLSTSVGDISSFVIGLYYICGIAIALGGVFKLKKLGVRSAMMGGDGSYAGPLIQLLIGAALVYSPTLLGALNTTFWGNPAFQTALSWSSQNAGSSSQLVAVFTPLIGIIKLVGCIAFLRGWLILTRVGNGGGQQPGTVSKGIVHIVGGLLAMNITMTMTVIMNTLGL